MQQIVAQLIFNGVPDVEIHALSPWLDMRIIDHGKVLANLEAQRNGRWRDILSPTDTAYYESTARSRLGAGLAAWLAEGGSLQNDTTSVLGHG